MKAFLLSAGEGTRLRPLTENLPKCLVPIRGIPVLAIWLEICRCADINEVLVNLHWKPDSVRRFLREYQTPLKVNVTYEPELLGSAGTVRENWKWVQYENRFWVIYTDVLTTASLGRIATYDSNQNDAILTMALHRVADPAGCGIAMLDERGRITGFEEKGRKPKGSLAFAGILLSQPALIERLSDQIPLDFGHDVFPHLSHRMRGYIISDYLVDIGTKERLAWAEETWPGLPQQGATTQG